MIKKRVYSFLIVEVLIALLMISMTILPFSSFPYKAFKKELKALEQMTVEPYFTPTFLEVIQAENQQNIILEDLTVPFGKKERLKVHRTATVELTEDPKRTKSTLTSIKVTFKTKNHTQTRTRVFFSKKSRSKHEV